MRILGIEHAPQRADGIKESIESEIQESLSVEIVGVYNEDAALKPIEELDAIVLSGGPMGVYQLSEEKYEYIKKEVEYVEEAIAKRTPILGICFGHQLLCDIFGGEVKRIEERNEIGWFDVEILDRESPLFKEVSSPLHVFQYHNDHIISPPSRTKILAQSDRCEIQALKYQDYPIYSVQFHPEIAEQKGSNIFERLGYTHIGLPEKSISDRTKIFRNFLLDTVKNKA
jgi:GMP synthase (glutamine-hydrolysing)